MNNEPWNDQEIDKLISSIRNVGANFEFISHNIFNGSRTAHQCDVEWKRQIALRYPTLASPFVQTPVAAPVAAPESLSILAAKTEDEVQITGVKPAPVIRAPVAAPIAASESLSVLAAKIEENEKVSAVGGSSANVNWPGTLVSMPMEWKAIVPTQSELINSLTEAYGPIRKEGFFPEILLDIMSNPVHAHIIGWEHDGNTFIIRKPEALSDVLHKYKIKSYSFIEELYRWGFQKVSGQNVFYHEYFLRDETGKIVKMKRDPTRVLGDTGSGNKERGKKRTVKSSSDGSVDTGSGKKKKKKKKSGIPFSGEVIDLYND